MRHHIEEIQYMIHGFRYSPEKEGIEELVDDSVDAEIYDPIDDTMTDIHTSIWNKINRRRWKYETK